jgi:hypothetical protein
MRCKATFSEAESRRKLLISALCRNPKPEDPAGSGSFPTVLLELMRYLVNTPMPDTVKGIVEWWKPAGGAACSEEEVRAALDFLSARSWVTVRSVGEAGTLYGAQTERLPEMRRFLADLEHRRDPEEEEKE